MMRVETALQLSAPESVAVPPPPVVSEAPRPPPPARRSGEIETRVGLTIANRAGVITLVIGVGFLFKIAVDNQWIGPAERVMLGVLASFGCLAAADVLWRRGHRVFAQGATATGIGILYLSFYAAFGFYHLIPQSIVLVLMAMSTAMAAALAMRYGALAIATLGLIGGFLTPIVLSTGEDHPWFLFSYLLLLDLGALALARIREWRLLEVLGFAGTALQYGAWLAEGRPDREFVATLYALVFYALFAATIEMQPVFLVLQFAATLVLPAIWPSRPGPFLSMALAFVLGALAAADRRHWRFAPTAALTAYAFSYLIWWTNLRDPIPTGAVFFGITCAFLALFAWLPWWVVVRNEPARAQDLTVMALNGGAYFAASYLLLNPGYHAWMGIFAVAVAALHLALGAYLWKRRSSTPALLALGVALTFLTLAAPIQFTAYRITLSWALEAAALTWIGIRVKNRGLPYAGIAIFILVYARLCAIDAWVYSSAGGNALLWNERFLTFAVTAACLWLSAYWLRPLPLGVVHYISGHVVLLWGLTQEALDWAARSTPAKDRLSVETVTISILYAMYAVALISIGVGSRSAINRIAGLGLIGFVVVKLYLFDVWQLSRLYRTLAFVALGLLLLSTSFLYSHFRALVESWWKDDQARA